MSEFLDLNCPLCGGNERLQIVGTIWLDVMEDRTELADLYPEYHPHSFARCGACGFTGIVTDFEPKEGDQLPLPLTTGGHRK